MTGEYKFVKFEEILPPTGKSYDHVLEALRKSVGKHGLLVHLTLVQVGNKYEIIDGVTRYKILVELTDRRPVPAFVVQLGDGETIESVRQLTSIKYPKV